MKIKKTGARLFFCALLLLFFNARAGSEFRPGEVWRDTDGQPVQAHGGGILVHGNIFYWYGEDRTPGIRSAVSCYSSTNLLDWKREGVALWQTNLPHYYGSPTFVERPKVIFNARTGKYVMWMHAEQSGYLYACAGTATSATPTGPFVFLKTFRPITNNFEFPENDATAQNKFGGTFRDMNLFVDDDGRAYVFYSSEDNWTMYVVRLNDDFTGPELPAIENKTWARILVRQMREGAAPFKWNGKYFLITSACTGWKPNAANYSTADNILGPWKTFDNPCIGTNAGTTFGSQSTFVLPVPGKPGDFVFMADQWRPENLADSRYVWLPLTIKTNGTFTVQWRDRWDFSAFAAH
jgi:Glycosyl hydrolases family 43